MTDIHDLDQYVGRYVVLTDLDGEGAAGFLTEIYDAVDYIPHPVRAVTLHWGQGWRIAESTDVDVYSGAPDGEQPPQVTSGIDVLHKFAHEGRCPDGNCWVRARRQLRALREWRMMQQDAYWENLYVKRVRRLAGEDLLSAGEIMREAVYEGAPPHIVDRMKSIVDSALKEEVEGE